MGKIAGCINYFASRKTLTAILILSFLLSVIYSFHFKIKPVVDARAYDNIAMNILSGNGYREDLNMGIDYDYAIARVGPLYEYFLAGIYKVFGHNYGVVWIVQALLHALTAWLVYLIALSALANYEYKEKAALLAAAFIGFFPDLIEISAMLMTETMYIFLFCLMLYLFFRQFEKSNFGQVISLGIISGLAILARPPVLFLVPVILFFFYQKRKILVGLIFCLALFAALVPWTVRNYKVYHEFMPLGAAGAYNFWIGNYHGADGEQSPTKEQYEFTASHPIRDVQPESVRQFKSFLRNYPGEFIKLTLLRVNKYFSIIRPMGFWFYQHGIGQMLFVLSSAIFGLVMLVFGLAGFVQSLKEKNEKLYYILALAVATPLILFVSVVETRYRFQIYPLLAILGGFFVGGLFGKTKWWRNKILWLAVGMIFLNGIVDLILNINKIVDRLHHF